MWVSDGGELREEGGMAVRLSMFSGGGRAGECRERTELGLAACKVNSGQVAAGV